MRLLFRLLSKNWHPGRAAVAGLLATLVYSAAMEGDTVLIGNRFNDVRFIEGIIGGTQRTKKSLVLAWLIHLLNGVALAELYAAIGKRFLPGPDWLKGSIFGEAFITAAWVLTPLADKYHPLIQNGEMPPLANWRSFGQNLLRHLAYGLTLGLLYRDRA
ncbi:hypothetical protein EI42_05349 [Thermosporothrix hazakensis]|jgi:hypothetical protein|uniref:Uncharacterized protein n=1 Tax=Thermosporothrix hazakensis TaxID=644383 RepID=A0A326U0C3_THEHA|nr:DUF6789 family protein [Thermosporothrix hazakensis]PZW22564.1 hypothetical protein EI42_05349 [Thermosporothrix hazakensis]GCE48536.1 hypothetical protein KTH_34050 [Thermosporothrix hazakensis]